MNILRTLIILFAAIGISKTALAHDLVNYGDTIGIFAEDNRARLDVGIRAMKEEVPASHESWATKLVIKRLDGRNDGPVSSEHLVGIFSEDGRVRLDIGIRGVKEEIPAIHESWATKLVIKRLDGNSQGPVYYGDVVGIFSKDGRVRLDVGIRHERRSSSKS